MPHTAYLQCFGCSPRRSAHANLLWSIPIGKRAPVTARENNAQL
jgi:hypothetical protein